MAELLTALGIMLVLAVGAWYLGSLLLRVAAFWCLVGAGLLLLVASEGDVNRGPALFVVGRGVLGVWRIRPEALPATCQARRGAPAAAG